MNFQLPQAANGFFAGHGDGDSDVNENGKKAIGLY